MHTLKVIAALLHYPDEAVQAHADELIEVLDGEGLVGGSTRAGIVALIEDLRDGDLMDAQSRYIETFDRGRQRSLYLFEHVHGESRDRGAAMVDLQRAYADHGFEIAVSELPDYVPLFLEFCASLPDEQALAWLEEVGHLLQLLHARLRERDSVYAVLLEPLLAFAAVPLDDPAVRDKAAGEERDDTAEALDRVWMEEPVTFGPEGECASSVTRRKPAVQAVQWGAPRRAGSGT
ncbi:nitrate reductase molybdenum cofactor assembly chaperone [Arhodomonas sp. AD133]|uniref:nitrate reductase molybdenum cofactor assembly chaperone n=1 Tax=Arhodomonas sp. AD133 TaxID=3415009 RepID=UPI003EB7E03B